MIDVAPAPVFTGLVRAHDRVLGRMEMFRGVLVLRRVAASDVPAFQAKSEMDPGIAHLEAFLTPVRPGRDVPNLVQVGAKRSSSHARMGILVESPGPASVRSVTLWSDRRRAGCHFAQASGARATCEMRAGKSTFRAPCMWAPALRDSRARWQGRWEASNHARTDTKVQPEHHDR